MKNVNQIFDTVTEALAAGISVFLTDGTVTREVVWVEISHWGFKDTLDIEIIDGFGNKVWKEIEIVWLRDELDGYGMIKLDGDLYIAPDWWIAL